jgi:hypothetical protein
MNTARPWFLPVQSSIVIWPAVSELVIAGKTCRMPALTSADAKVVRPWSEHLVWRDPIHISGDRVSVRRGKMVMMPVRQNDWR